MWKSLCIALAMYSKIPVPQFEWKDEDMRYAMVFFPVVGVVIGALELVWLWIAEALHLTDLLQAVGMTILPILVTGGLHLDGLLDTSDALHSYQGKERKLEILKDPHIGAFAAIQLAVYLLVYTALAAEGIGTAQDNLATGMIGFHIWQYLGSVPIAGVRIAPAGLIWGFGFIASRAMSGIAVVTYPSASGKGSLYQFASAASKQVTLLILVGVLMLSGFMVLWIHPILGICAIIACVVSAGWFAYMSRKQFGGITGDLAGWYLCMTELLILVGITIGSIICRVS